MPVPSGLPLFLAASLTLLLMPGPAVLYITTQSAGHGRRAGLACVAGIATGGFVHVLAAALGLSALLASSAAAFAAVRWAGAAYLVSLGVRKLMDRSKEGETEAPAPRRLSSLYAEGVLVNVLNPKTALFFLAFLPQFVDASRPVAPQVLVLGGIFQTLAFLTDSSYALLAGAAARLIRSRRGSVRLGRWLSGGVYIGLGVATAFAGGRRK
jgi:threonine/homoserine/homoserine lactone efflux protein